MAKVINPLLSGSASGQFGHMMTFDKRGIVRAYVVPANPQTEAQQTVRNTLGDLQRSLKLLGPQLRGELKSQFGYRWNSVIIGELMSNGNSALDAYVAEFSAFTGGQVSAWETADTSGPALIADGACLYAVASAVYDIGVRIGATLDLTQPAAANSATIAVEWVV